MCRFSLISALMIVTALVCGTTVEGQVTSPNENFQRSHVPPPGSQNTADQPSVGAAGRSADGRLATAMANFAVRTGLDIATDQDGRIVVRHVRPESDAARAGVKPGDILSSVNGIETPTLSTLQRYLAARPVQGAFDIGLEGERGSAHVPMGRHISAMGLTIFPDSADRPVVSRVAAGSAADKAGFKAGDVIVGVDHQTTDTMQKFMNFALPYIRDLSEGQKIPFRVAREGAIKNFSIPRPKDSDLPPPTPSEQRILERQSGVLSTATQEPAGQPTRATTPRGRRNRNENQNQNGAVPLAGAAGLTGTIPTNQNTNPQQNGFSGGGFGLGLPGVVGGTDTTGGTGLTNGTTNGLQPFANVNAVVAVLSGNPRNMTPGTTAGTTQGTTRGTTPGTMQGTMQQGAGGQATANLGRGAFGRVPNLNPPGSGASGASGGVPGFNRPGVVGFVQIQSTVPLSQSATNPLGTANGTTNGTTTGTTTGTTGTTTGATTGTTTGGVNNTNNTGKNLNQNNASTVSARVVGLPQGQYILAVNQFGDCGDVAGISPGPVAAVLGTIQVGGNGQGLLQNQSVGFPPQAFLGRVVSLLRQGAAGTGTAVFVTPRDQAAMRSGNQTTGTNPNTPLACGVFGLANPIRPFGNHGFFPGGVNPLLNNGTFPTGVPTGTTGIPGTGTTATGGSTTAPMTGTTTAPMNGTATGSGSVGGSTAAGGALRR